MLKDLDMEFFYYFLKLYTVTKQVKVQKLVCTAVVTNCHLKLHCRGRTKRRDFPIHLLRPPLMLNFTTTPKHFIIIYQQN